MGKLDKFYKAMQNVGNVLAPKNTKTKTQKELSIAEQNENFERFKTKPNYVPFERKRERK